MEKPDNDDHAGQLRLLRLLLGQNFKPVSAELFAAMVRINPASIRSIETARRPLTEETRRKIAIRLGTEWDNETRQWICTWSGRTGANRKIPFNRLEYDVYVSNHLDSKHSLVAGNRTVVHSALELLTEALSAKEANIAMMEILDHMADIAKENGLNEGVIEELELQARRIVTGDPGQLFPVRFGGVVKKPSKKRPPSGQE